MRYRSLDLKKKLEKS